MGIKKQSIGKTTNKYIGGVSMLRKSVLGVIFLFSLFILGQSAWANPNYEDANQFYQNKVDKKEYEEYSDSKMKVRELVIVRKLPDLMDSLDWDYSERKRSSFKDNLVINTEHLNPEQLVYYYLSLKQSGNRVYCKEALYDAKTNNIIFNGERNWITKTNEDHPNVIKKCLRLFWKKMRKKLKLQR